MNDLLFSGRGLLDKGHHAPYDLLSYLPPGLMLDIGASNGAYTRLMLARSPGSTAIAFEPFPGNLPLIREALSELPNAELVEKAVSDDETDMPFFVSASVGGVDEGWSQGYSSLGHIVTDGQKVDPDKTILVPTVSVDEAIGDQRVRFMKVDVQGGEMSVLRSASRALEEQRIDIMYLEYSGEDDVLAEIFRHDYVVFDSQYIVLPLSDDADLSAWDLVEPVTLSTGQVAHRCWPASMPTTAAGYIDFLLSERYRIGNAFTDLVCVARPMLSDFIEAATKNLES